MENYFLGLNISLIFHNFLWDFYKKDMSTSNLYISNFINSKSTFSVVISNKSSYITVRNWTFKDL